MVAVVLRNGYKASRADYDIGTLLASKLQKNDIGLEVEVEGNIFPKPSHHPSGVSPHKPELIPAAWQYHKDGSLRGKDNAEYVLTKPVKFNDVEKHVNDLWDMFDKCGSVLDVSNRTSIHVHLNVQRWHLNRFASFCALYFAVEEILTAWCGEHRVGNLFCLRAKDAPALISRIRDFIVNNGDYKFPESYHYAGFNAHALNKFGSIEIRSLRGVTDKDTLLRWVNILRHLYDLSASYPDPTKVVEGFSSEGALSFLNSILGEHATSILEDLQWQHYQVQDAMLNGVRLVQDICYSRDWSTFKPVSLQPDPFGRSLISKKTAQASYATQDAVAQPVGQTISMDIESAVPYQPTWMTAYQFQTLYNAPPAPHEYDEENF